MKSFKNPAESGFGFLDEFTPIIVIVNDLN